MKSHQDGAFQPFQKGENDGRDSTKKKQLSSRAAPPAPDAVACSTAETANGQISRREERSQGQGQAARRKQRRCWSPELHRLFLQSLQQLGGPHGGCPSPEISLSVLSSSLFHVGLGAYLIFVYAVATPKQIREVMKVDGLTNDEVKSHLQVGLSLDFFHPTILVVSLGFTSYSFLLLFSNFVTELRRMLLIPIYKSGRGKFVTRCDFLP